MRMADRIVLMRGGRISQQGTAEELYDRPNSLFVARFFSALNELGGTISNGRAVTRIADFAWRGAGEGTAVVVAVRPQGVRLATGAATVGKPGRIVSRHFLGEIELFD